ncbi:hypothetical protein V8J36_21515 [Frigidibacter sp. MR17.14]|uniref:hypothetical protein n=1 Tax=Frigidibacter sp. MR17.14 TaxID=3126509 RepID=UPI003012B30C
MGNNGARVLRAPKDLSRLAIDLKRFGWRSLLTPGPSTLPAWIWLREEQGIDTVFIDGSFHAWIVTRRWGMPEFERSRNFRAAHQNAPDLTPEASKLK